MPRSALSCPPLMASYIYKVCSNAEWSAAQQAQVFVGSAVDLADGFIHFSTADQLSETLLRHFKDQTNLVALRVPVSALQTLDLRWEPSRGDDLFPHLYGALSAAAVDRTVLLEVDPDGVPRLPDGAFDD